MKTAPSIAEIFRAAYRKVVPTKGKSGKQKELVYDAGVNQSTLSNISTGRRPASEDQRRAIAKALGFDYDDFLDLGRVVLGVPVEKKEGEKNHLTYEQRLAVEAFEKILTKNDFAAKMLIDNVLQYAKAIEEAENPTLTKVVKSA